MKQFYPLGAMNGSFARMVSCIMLLLFSQQMLADSCPNDVTPPIANCYPNITIQLGAVPFFSINPSYVNDGSTDDCGIATMQLDKTDFTCADIGVNPVVLTVTDLAGNTATCTTMVTVVDVAPPLASCKNITVQLDASGSVTIAAGDIDDHSFDCNIQSMSIDKHTFTCADLGANTVTLTVTDNNGLSSTCTSIVTVVENQQPVAACKDITLYLDATGNATLTPMDVDNGSSDNCGIASMTLSKTQFVCGDLTSPIKPPVAVTLTITDNSGNVSSCASNVTVKDTTPPSFTCPADISDTLLTTCERDLVLPIPNIFEACGGFSIIPMTDNGVALTITGNGVEGTFPRGTTVVTYKIDDGFGNWAMCSFNVTLDDVTPPFIPIPVDTFVLPNDPGLCGNIINVHPCITPPVPTDNCGIENITMSHGSGDFFPVGATTITITATDSSGLSTTEEVVVIIEDVEPPMLLCKDLKILLNNGNNLQNIDFHDIISDMSDNCGIDTASITISDTTFNCSSGSQAVTVSVSDIHGNVATCTATVNVIDTEKPQVACKDTTVYLDNNGNVTITPATIDNGSSDNCAIASMTIDKATFDCNHLGQNAVKLKVTDTEGNMDSCYASVTVLDTIAPDAICKNITVQLGANGTITITPAMVNNNSTDNCTIASMTLSETNFDCSHIGSNTVTLTVTDNSGNISTCTSTITVEDPNSGPSVTCKDATVYLDIMGFAYISSNDIVDQSSATCGIASTTLSQSAFDCMYIGVNQITVTVTDNNGVSTNCTANVTVLDTLPPSVNCQSITVQLNADGQANIMAAHMNFGSSDNCGIASKVLSKNNFNCNDIGPNTVTLTVTDNNGNVKTCTGTVTVEDNLPPVAKCQDVTVPLVNGQATITTAMVNDGSTDNCGIASMTLSKTIFDCNDVGENTVTLTLTDVNGNVSTCTSKVTITDNDAPSLVCKNATLQLDANGQVVLTQADVIQSAGANCGTLTSIELSQTNFDCTHIGTNTVTITVTGSNGLTATCDATVTVEDVTAPIAKCRNRTINLNNNGIGVLTPGMINNGSSDNCGIASLHLSKTTFDCDDIGTHTITFTITDNTGLTASCTSTVTVRDNRKPNAKCKDITVQLGANGQATITAAMVDDASTDNCGIQSLAIDKTTFDCGDIGANTVTLTVTDVNGNTETCTATVTVENNSTPSVLCKNTTIQLDNNGEATITASDVINSVNGGSCGNATTTLSKTNFDCTNIGANTVTVTVTAANGQTATCTATVIVEDVTAPIAKCRNRTINLNNNGEAVLTTAMINNGSSDNCGIASMSLSQTNFDCDDIGTQTVTLTVTDNSGLTSTCTATVNIRDNKKPIAKCKDITVQLGANGQASITAAMVNDGSTDNCGIQSLAIDKTTFDCGNLGANTVTLTVTDVNGNVKTCTSTVTVTDNSTPSVLCKNKTIYLNNQGEATITISDVTNSINGGNCGNPTTTLSQTNFDCTHLGTNTVTVTVTAANGQTATCNATVTVKDNKKPIAKCRNMTVQLNNNGQAVVTSAMINNGSTDNCGIASMSVSPNTFDCNDLGQNTVTLTVTDASGNSKTCTAQVNVVDNKKPVAKCKNVTIYLNNAGKAWTTMQAVDDGSTDNCGIVKTTLSKKDFNCSHIGQNTVTLKVEDASGNTAQCTAIITVKDNKKPVAKCKDIVVTLGNDGKATITAVMIDNGSTDNCAVVSRVANKTQFTCADLGVNNVKLTVKDASGNADDCIAKVTVKSNFAITPDPVDAGCGNGSVTCTDGNPSNAYAVRLHGITNSHQDYQSNPNNPLKITTKSDGTAKITGEIRLKSNHNYRWQVEVHLKDRMDQATYHAVYNGTPWSNNGDPTQTWDYYIMDDAKTNRYIGKGSFHGKTLNLKHAPTNLTKAFQIGIAASIYRTTYSIAGWFSFKGSYTGTGDFDFDLENCTNTGSVVYKGDAPSNGYAVRLHGVTPNKDYKSDPHDPLTLTDLGNGNATITGQIINKSNSNQKWKVEVYLKNKMDLATYAANFGGSAWANNGDPTTTWDYYLMDHSKNNRFIGKGHFNGKTLNLKHKPSDLKKAFQVGIAASIHRTTLSIAGWFSFTGSYTGTGDFDFDLVTQTPIGSCDGIAKVNVKGCGPFTYKWSTGSTSDKLTGICAGAYKVTVTDGGNNTKTATVNVGGVNDCTPTPPTPPTNTCPAVTCGKGKVLAKEYHTGSSSNAISTITNHSSYPNNPSNTFHLTKLEKNGIHAKRGLVISGFIIPPTTGKYDFYFASDDNGRFFLSSDCDPANKSLIAQVTPQCGWTHYKQWNKCPEQKKLNVNLVKDKPYYFEVFVKNGGGAGHFAVGWKKPGSNSIVSISGNQLALKDCPPTNNCPAVTCGKGSLEVYEYSAGSSYDLSSVTNNANFPSNPSNAYNIHKLEYYGIGNHTGAIVKGYIIPPTTGNYDFFFAGDNRSKFWLSTDCQPANKVLSGEIGSSCNHYTNYKQFNKCSSQKRTNVYLVKNKPYYFEILVKNVTGGGHFAVGWKKPGSNHIQSISGNQIAKYKCATCSSLTNIAKNKPTYQSSTAWGGVSSRAVDGNTNGIYSHGSVTHTHKQTNAFWELDLQKIHKIDHIKVYNRKDCCANRLKHYYVLVSNKPFTSSNLNTLLNDPNVWSKYYSSQAGYPTTVPVHRTGRYVCIMLKYKNYLSLAEVKVMGCSIGNVLARSTQEGPEEGIVSLTTIENTPTETEIEEEEAATQPTTQSFEVKAYPNPFNNRITVEGFVPDNEEYINIRILNVQGQEVHRQQRLQNTGDVKVEMTIPDLQNGVYILEATTAKNRKTVKLVRMNHRP